VGGIGTALVIIATQFWGKQDTRSIRSLTTICLWVALGVGGIFTFFTAGLPAQTVSVFSNKQDVITTAIPYFKITGFSFVFFALSQVLIASQRSVEKVRFGMYVALIALVFNISLNYCLIFGKFGFPALGITGAALATLISRIIEAAIVAVYVFGIDKRIGLRLRDMFSFEKKSLLLLAKYGILLVMGDLVWAINNFVYTAIVGRFTADVIASFNIAGMMNTLVYVWIAGLAGAVGIMTGKQVGAGEHEGLKPFAYRIQKLFLLVGVITGLFIFFVKDLLISMYHISPEAVIGARQLMTVLSFTIAGTAYQMTSLFGLVKSGGNISFVFKNDTIFVFLVIIPASIIAMVIGAPAWVVFLCLKCDQILKCFVAVVVVNRFKWIRNLAAS
jgi:putative MATE family efflux protein